MNTRFATLHVLALSALVGITGSCASPLDSAAPTAAITPGDPLQRSGDEISVCGQLFHTGTPVVLWNDTGGYDAYRLERRFGDLPGQEPASKVRYGVRRDLPVAVATRVAKDGWRVQDLQEVVRMFVIHFDAAGTSRRCFKVLDERDLSVHFLLDVDGTIYQTLDLKERAWHATLANNHSVGIEIAHPGAFSQPQSALTMRWYAVDDTGTVRMKFPAFVGDPAQRDASQLPYPDRPGVFEGEINGRTRYQRDFTSAQYRALAHLTAALHRVLPRIRLDAPRTGPGGAIQPESLPAESLASYEGILGHFHVQANKDDPGPAFQWLRLLEEAAALVPSNSNLAGEASR